MRKYFLALLLFALPAQHAHALNTSAAFKTLGGIALLTASIVAGKRVYNKKQAYEPKIIALKICKLQLKDLNKKINLTSNEQVRKAVLEEEVKQLRALQNKNLLYNAALGGSIILGLLTTGLTVWGGIEFMQQETQESPAQSLAAFKTLGGIALLTASVVAGKLVYNKKQTYEPKIIALKICKLQLKDLNQKINLTSNEQVRKAVLEEEVKQLRALQNKNLLCNAALGGSIILGLLAAGLTVWGGIEWMKKETPEPTIPPTKIIPKAPTPNLPHDPKTHRPKSPRPNRPHHQEEHLVLVNSPSKTNKPKPPRPNKPHVRATIAELFAQTRARQARERQARERQERERQERARERQEQAQATLDKERARIEQIDAAGLARVALIYAQAEQAKAQGKQAQAEALAKIARDEEREEAQARAKRYEERREAQARAARDEERREAQAEAQAEARARAQAGPTNAEQAEEWAERRLHGKKHIKFTMEALYDAQASDVLGASDPKTFFEKLEKNRTIPDRWKARYRFYGCKRAIDHNDLETLQTILRRAPGAARARLANQDNTHARRLGNLTSYAAKENNLAALRLLTEELGLSPHQACETYDLPLTEVVKNHDGAATPVIDYLLEQGALLDSPDEEGLTALHHAAINNHFEAEEELEKRGADPDYHDFAGRKPYSYRNEEKYTRFIRERVHKSFFQNLNDRRTAPEEEVAEDYPQPQRPKPNLIDMMVITHEE